MDKLIKKIEPHDFNVLLAILSSFLPPSLFPFFLFFFFFGPPLSFCIVSSITSFQDLALVHGFCHKRLINPIKES